MKRLLGYGKNKIARTTAAFDALLFTCEHGGNRVPVRYQKLFKGEKAVLKTHRGLDIGALAVARLLAKKLDAPLFYSTTSRLLIDLNRSLDHKGVFSEFSLALATEERAKICARYYTPYRQNVEAWIRSQVRLGRRVLHLSVHSFTPELNGELRQAEIGYLYHPQRKAEAHVATTLQKLMATDAKKAGWRQRRNYPYHGADDGLTTYLRGVFAPHCYLGLELEMNQQIVAAVAGQKQMALSLSHCLLAMR